MISEPDKQRGLPAGYRLLEYEILEELGSGGFGITYLARDLNLHREVVIKENLPTFAFRDTQTSRVYPNSKRGEAADLYEWSLDNFVEEARTLARFDHPNIVRILRVFEANGTAYFVMPHLEGRSFDQVIEERRKSGGEFTEEELRSLLESLFGALDELHEAGFYHRDLKPANVLMTARGPVLIDFGAARQQISEKTETVFESIGYTPFEQMQTKGNVGPWSDLYGLGAIVYRALTFEAPPKAMDRVRKDPIRILAEDAALLNRCSRGFLESIDRALAFDESDRPQSVSEWRAMLRVEGEPLPVAPKKPEPPSRGKVESLPRADPPPAKEENGRGRRAVLVPVIVAFLGAVTGALLWVAKPWQSGVVVTSEPTGAIVSVAGEEKGTTPLHLDLPAGTHALAVRLDPWPGEVREIELEIGRRIEELFVFKPATVVLKGSPAGARVSVDGGEEETLPVTVELPPGVYDFEARFENWPPQKREVAVSAGERVELGFTFEPVSVELTSVPAGAEVRESGTGRVLGTTPLALGDLTPGPVSWEVVLAGHEPAKWERNLKPGNNGPERVELSALMEGAEAGEVRTFGGIEMVWCPRGEFLMGSPETESGRNEDETQHRVTLTQGFWLAKTECTQAQWEEVMGTNPSHFKGKDMPVEMVSWVGVQGWLQRMNERTRLPGDWKWDLPSEAQWEYACRAGADTRFSGALDQIAWHEENSFSQTQRVGTKQANSWGLHDMHGNVWEWCRDWYGDYSRGLVTRSGPFTDLYRVLRGGSCLSNSMGCRSAYRRRFTPSHFYHDVGFRPALVRVSP